ncbi:hypothetical protein E1B28_001959 [Marasmius oreades]|uniref:Uncharacterized protein n=1 Tax=Marasmius oreades TaxID=181124 RepID=A0A9P8AFZ1_9AGAR|nr:uncharacterized protein E1B28_001959 [Marasmius oreades]KAG7100182.1 hypothetical protein E1B28_001959 [Marasmius oreades]
MANSPISSYLESHPILSTLTLLREEKDDVFGTIADLALKIFDYRSIARIHSLVVTSCETAYAANFYTQHISQTGQGYEPEGTSLADKLARLTETLDDILLLSSRIASRGRLSATIIGYIGFWELNEIKRLQDVLKVMIIHDFWPEVGFRTFIAAKTCFGALLGPEGTGYTKR